jgi:hypothetical protein
MIARRLAFVLLIAGAAAAPVAAQDADLRWRLAKGQTFYQSVTTVTRQVMTIDRNRVEQKQNQTFHFRWTPLDDPNDGLVELEQTIIGLKMDLDAGGSKVTYDSLNPPAGGGKPIDKFFAAMVGGRYTLTVDLNRREVTGIKGAEEFIGTIVKANPQMKPLLEKILSERALREMVQPTFAALPGRRVPRGGGPGAAWTIKSDLDMGPIGRYATTYTYGYDGPDDRTGLERIRIKTDLKYTPPDPNAPAQLPFRVKAAKLDAKDAGGTVLYDPAAGRIARHEMGLTLVGELTIEIKENATTVGLEQTQKTTSVFSDKDPTAKGEKNGDRESLQGSGR